MSRSINPPPDSLVSRSNANAGEKTTESPASPVLKRLGIVFDEVDTNGIHPSERHSVEEASNLNIESDMASKEGELTPSTQYRTTGTKTRNSFYAKINSKHYRHSFHGTFSRNLRFKSKSRAQLAWATLRKRSNRLGLFHRLRRSVSKFFNQSENLNDISNVNYNVDALNSDGRFYPVEIAEQNRNCFSSEDIRIPKVFIFS